MKTRFLIFASISLFISTSVIAQTPNYLWAKSAKGASADEPASVCTDPSGNVFVTGYFYSPTIIFGTDTLTNSGTCEAYIVKYDAAGNVLWAKSASGGNELSQTICSDASGNVFIAGIYLGPTITFGSFTLTNGTTGSFPSSSFLVKYDPSGTVLWADNISGTNYEDGINNITCDPSGNVIIVGDMQSFAITFGTTTYYNAGAVGRSDMFVAKYDPSGNVLWGRTVGGTFDDFGKGVSTDASGNIFITGGFGSTSITAGSFTLTTSGGEDVYLIKYSPSGNVLLAKSAGGTTNDDEGRSISIDASGNMYVTGTFKSSSFIFGTTTLPNGTSGSSNIFLLKFDSSGNPAWAKGAGGPNYDYGTSVAADAFGDVILTGQYANPSITFGTTTLTTTFNNNAFIAKYNTLGNVLYAISPGGNAFSGGSAACIDPSNNVIVVGQFASHKIVFGIDTLINSDTLSYNDDVFVVKLDNSITTGVSNKVTDDDIDWKIYPNPYSNSTTINYTLIKRSDIIVEVYDIIGNKVETLANTTQLEGQYMYQFSAKQKGYDAGVYFVKITVDGKSMMKRVVEMK